MEVSVIIPNFNGIAFLDSVLGSLEGQTLKNFEVILVDNGSADGSCSFVSANYPWVHIIELPDNFGFCRAVNEGIKAAKAPYVLLLNNDTEVKEDFVEQMLLAIRRHKNAFSCAARMVQYHDRDKLDDAGNYYCALGWSFARGKGKNIDLYQKEEKIFSACGGAAIVKRSWKRSDILMRSISHIWRIRISDTVPEFMDMKTGMHRMQSYIMWEVVRVDPDIIISRPDILPEIIFI